MTPQPPTFDAYPASGFYVAHRRFPPLEHAPERGWQWGCILDGPVEDEAAVVDAIDCQWRDDRWPTRGDLRVWLFIPGAGVKDVTDWAIFEVQRLHIGQEAAE